MKIKRWYFKNNYEDYKVLFENNIYILVQNIDTNKYSFGVAQDFGSFYGFPVNQSCLSKNECIEILQKFIEIDRRYYDVNNTIKIYNEMIEILQEV